LKAESEGWGDGGNGSVGVYHVRRDDVVSWLERELVSGPLETDVEQCPIGVVLGEAAAA
jgi:hypothetical protein